MITLNLRFRTKIRRSLDLNFIRSCFVELKKEGKKDA